MPAPNILVVAIDGLRAAALGAYGNTSFATPVLDQIAAESFLFDSCYAPSADLSGVYRALWQSIHPARPECGASHRDGAQIARSLPRMLRELGYATTLVTDEPKSLSFAFVDDFDECIQLAADADIEKNPVRADDVSQTAMARVFSAACDVVAPRQTEPRSPSARVPRFIWLHSCGMYGAWDAPIELQQSLLDEGDPPPVEARIPPDFLIASDAEPDAIFRHSCAYAAQVMSLDACCRDLLEYVYSDRASEQWLVVVLGTRGYPLGEHRRVGGVDPRLYAEQLHVPWLVRFPDGLGRLARSDQLVSHFDVMPTLLDYIESAMGGDRAGMDGMSALPLAPTARVDWRDALVFASGNGSQAIRTAAWSLRREGMTSDAKTTSREATSPQCELFVRPDDRWEANDVAKLCPDVVDALGSAMNDTLQKLSAGDAKPLTSLLSAGSASRC